MPEPGAAPRIAVLGHVGNGNLGDEAILASVFANLRRRLPGVSLLAITANPDDTRRRHGVPAAAVRGGAPARPALAPDQIVAAPAPGLAPGRQRLQRRLAGVPLILPALRGLRRLAQRLRGLVGEVVALPAAFRTVRGTSLLMVAGSGQVNDFFGGPFGYPWSLLKWTALGRLAGANVAYASVGAGPISDWLSRRLLRLALSLARYRSYRDEHSLALVRDLGLDGAGRLVPDLAFGLPCPAGGPRPATRPVVGLNPLPFAHAGAMTLSVRAGERAAAHFSPEDARARYDAYVARLAGFVAWLDEGGYEVVLFPTQVRLDPPVIRDIRAAGGPWRGVREATVATVDDLVTVVAGLDLVVATRYHGALLALLQGIPTLAIAYHPKTRDLFDMLGLGRHVLAVEEASAAALAERFEALVADAPAARAQLAARIPLLREAVDRQFDELVGLAGAPTFAVPRPAPSPRAVAS